MKRKNIIIDGDEFQKERIKQKEKTQVFGLVQGIILFIIAFAGLFLESKILLKLVVYLIPLLLIVYSMRLLTIAERLKKLDTSISITYLIQSILTMIISVYILCHPLDSLNFILIAVGLIIIINSISAMTYEKSYLPVGSIFIGIMLMLFPKEIVTTFYTLFLIVLLIYSIWKIITSIEIIKKR